MPPDLEFLPPALRRDLRAPVQLLLESHRPLAFVAGQALYVVAPLAALLGEPRVAEWAARLSAMSSDPARRT